MRYDIRHEGDHYALYINGMFHSSHDTVTEAANEIDSIVRAEEGAA